MLTFPFAKINLGLNVVRRRSDGFHEIESVMVPVPLTDALEIVVDPAGPPNAIRYARHGAPIDGPVEQDLVYKAIRAVQQLRDLPALEVHLLKAVPMGAGLGGGSSDGTHALRMVNTLLDLDLTTTELSTIAASLGSDCAFFLHEGPQLARGRGEVLEQVALDLRGHHLVLVNPGIHVSTAKAYSACTPTGSLLGLEQRVVRPVNEWPALLPNTLAPAVIGMHPEIGKIVEELYTAGAAYASMSGSGSSVFGIFEQQPPTFTWPAHYRAWNATW
ncbi:MAG: 4-(cytidine 5'-diphospho)-2-C-methyl-D-erythritol kinase [Flavobacteriales bacterium]|jgi:4-diphosphocytidyl-2-C-methyl-D-erythritol kinase|nr:4-(cytidine 5'-diphospho)-2-C-methyl-D-erythritol kinase [Flavobacteriales bacterium]